MKLDSNDLFYNFSNEEDCTAAGIIDGMLIDKHFEGDWEQYDAEEGYELRNKIISQLTEDFEIKLKVLVDNIKSEPKTHKHIWKKVDEDGTCECECGLRTTLE